MDRNSTMIVNSDELLFVLTLHGLQPVAYEMWVGGATIHTIGRVRNGVVVESWSAFYDKMVDNNRRLKIGEVCTVEEIRPIIYAWQEWIDRK